MQRVGLGNIRSTPVPCWPAPTGWHPGALLRALFQELNLEVSAFWWLSIHRAEAHKDCLGNAVTCSLVTGTWVSIDGGVTVGASRGVLNKSQWYSHGALRPVTANFHSVQTACCGMCATGLSPLTSCSGPMTNKTQEQIKDKDISAIKRLHKHEP